MNFLLVKIHTILTICLVSFFSAISQPSISTFTPMSGPIGSVVTIKGSGFSSSSVGNYVFFGAVKANVLSANQTTLIVTVPLGTTYEPISVVVNNSIAYSAKPFVVTFGSDSVLTNHSFVPKARITSGSGPANVVIGDLDGDRKPDLAVVNTPSNTLTLHRNVSIDSTILFESPKAFDNLFAPQVLNLGDLDGDGKLDIVATAFGEDKIVIYKNNSTIGNLSFQQLLKYPTENFVREIAIRDMDLDGKADIVLANTMGTISVFRNTTNSSTISFEPKVDFTAGDSPRGIAISDLDNDGKPDVIVSNVFSNSISIFKNNSTKGSIAFLPKADFAVGDHPEKVAVGDMDGDGKDDIAVVASGGVNTLLLFRNTSTNATISFASPVTYPTGLNPYNILMNDMNGDGKVDIVINNWEDKSISVFRNKSSIGSLIVSPRVDYPTLTTQSRGLASGDLDNDGRPEIVIANSGYNGSRLDSTISIFQNKIGHSIILPTPVSNNPDIRVYPNPANDKITVDTFLLNDNWKRMDVFAADGKYLTSYNLSNLLYITVNIDFLPSGTYFLVLHREEGKSITKKLIKLLK